LDLFKLPGFSYIKPGLLSKTKNHLQKIHTSKLTIAKQKPSCELFAPQPKRIFDKDYSKAIPKHLLLPDNTVKPPTKLVCNRKLVKKPAKNMAAGVDAIKRKRDPTPDGEDLSPDKKQIKLSPPGITGQHSIVSDDTKNKAFLLQKEKYLKRKFINLSGDLETKCKIPKIC